LNIIEVEDFSKVDDPVKTEETLHLQLTAMASSIDTQYSYVSMPLAWSINKRGLGDTQRRIDSICRHSKKLFFICQHILVDRLNFHGNLVFTPHATTMDFFTPIPHYSCNYDLNFSKPWEEREYTFSFVGSFLTHPVRRRIAEYLRGRKDCLVVDTGQWHFEGAQEKQQNNSRNYSEVLGDTKYSLCPRGTGPSTIRIWESMAMGAKPIILSDHLKMPLSLECDTQLWERTPEKFDNLDKFFNNEKYDNKEYFQFFSNENLYKSVTTLL